MDLLKMRNLGCVLFLFFTTSLLHAQVPAEQLMKELSTKLKGMLEQFKDSDYLAFSPGFYQEVSRDKLAEGFHLNSRLLGPIARTRICRLSPSGGGELEFIGNNGRRLRIQVRIEASPPHRINYLLFSKVNMDDDTWGTLRDDIQKLPGRHSATVWKLGANKSRLLSLENTAPLAVGSSFKLLILSLLCDEVGAGKRKWTDVVTLEDAGRSLPSGLLQDWPPGSPVTMHTLATMMIARSDNTAVDHLMLTLGRESIEKHQITCKVQDPVRNRPFLRTSELFKIKLVGSQEQVNQYAKASEQQKREYLSLLEKTRLVDPRMNAYPNAIDRVEWFFSTDDLCRIMERVHQSKEQAQGLAILGVAKPFDFDDFAWEYLGFKGGAELGVLNLSLMGKLRGKPDWYTFSFTWNNTAQAVDEDTWLRVIERSLQLVEKGK